MGELYILDDQFRRTEVVEQYESLIWTERWNSFGELTLEIDPTLAETQLTQQGTRFARDGSEYVMTLDTVELKRNDDGKKVLSVTGKSLEDIFSSRPNQRDFATAGTAATTQVLTGTPGAIMRDLFDKICRNNTVIPTDNIQYIQAGTYSAAGTIPEPSTSVTIRTELDTLYNTLKNIADTYALGFRLIRPADDSKLYFEVYAGSDRTSGQVTNKPVIFSQQLDSLTNTSEIRTTALLKNVAYVFAPNGSRIVYANGYDSTVTGLEKKVLIVDASDITLAAGASLNAALDQRGQEELAKARYVVAFDGEIPQNGPYIYGTHYKLGDIVEQRSDTGVTSNMRVTEQIFVSDKEGEKSYPTLTVDSLITPGTWYALPGSKVWYDYTTTQYWADQ